MNAASRLQAGSRLLQVLVFAGGAATMAVEMTASRLLAPYLGNSLPVWAVLIGVLLASMALGYLLGGRLADRYADPRLLYELTGGAAIAIGLVPYLARPILHAAAAALATYAAGLTIATLLGVLILFSGPVLLLSCISPFVTRLLLDDVASSGHTAGRIYALSTSGSLLGTLVPVFVLIPSLGTRRAFASISLMLLAIVATGLAQYSKPRATVWSVLFVVIAALALTPEGVIKPTAGLVYERESLYNYIQVLADGDSMLLKLNEGEGIQSVYNPDQLLTGYVYDYFLLVPSFRPADSAAMRDVCLIGLAGGTIAHQYQSVFPDTRIDGVELDPAIIEVSERYLGLGGARLNTITADGRQYLAATDQAYDVILIDAYHPPYIPFQLATREFFQLARERLRPRGIVAVNVARTETDCALVDAIASTLSTVFPQVYIADTRSNLNSVVIALATPLEPALVLDQLAQLEQPSLQAVAARAAGGIREFTATDDTVLTDNHAPIERIVHGIILRYLLGQPANEVNS